MILLIQLTKVRISERKTKTFLSFSALGLPLATIGTQEREYLRASLKGTHYL